MSYHPHYAGRPARPNFTGHPHCGPHGYPADDPPETDDPKKDEPKEQEDGQ